MSTQKLMRYGSYLFSVAGARVIGLLLSGLTFPYLVRVLGVETYGLWSYVVAISAFLDLVADPGLTTNITQHVAANRHKAAELLRPFYLLRVCTGILAAALVLGISHFEARSEAGHLLLLYGLGILVVNLISADHFLGALELFHARSLLTVIQQSAYATAVFLLVRRPADVKWVPISILGSSVISAAIGWVVLFRAEFRIPRTSAFSGWRSMLVPSLHYAASSFMSSLYHRTGHLLVRWLLGDYSLGLYAAAVRLLELLRGFVNTITYVTMPRLALASNSEENRYRVSRLALAAMAATSIPMTCGLIATSDLLVPWLLGANYSADASLVRWMAPHLITASAASLCSGTILYAMGRYRACLTATAAGAVGGVLLYVILIPALGIEGAGISFVLAELIVALVAFWQLPQEIRQIWKSPAVVFVSVAALLMAMAVKVGAGYAVRLPFLVAGGAVIYLAVCSWLGRRWFTDQLKAA
jgi:PST family polysaccharide transporter